MFFPEEMTELELIVPDKDLLAVTKILAGRGVFHQVDASYMGSQAGVATTEGWRERAAAYSSLERQLALITQALAVEEGAPPAEQAGMIDVDAIRPWIDALEQEVKDATGQLTINEKRIEQLQGYIRQLDPIAHIGLDMGIIHEPRYIHSALGVMPVANIERLQTSLARTPYVLINLHEDRENAVVWLTGTQRNADILDRAARSAYLNPLDLSGDVMRGTPSEIIGSLTESLKASAEHIEQQRARIAALRAEHAAKIQETLWQVRAARLLADAMAHYGKLNYTYLIVGWVPSSRVDALSDLLRHASGSIILDTRAVKREGGGNQQVPISLRNPGFLTPFEMLVTTYARPGYQEIDPTILITVTFPLLFGAMFGDVAHGLLLAAVGALVAFRKVSDTRTGSNDATANLGVVIMVCGLVATLFGFIYGSIFGLEDILPKSPFFKQFILIQPMESRIQVLEIAVGVGIVLLSIGFLLNLFNAWKARDWGRMLFDPNGLVGLVLYWSLLGLGASLLLPGFPVPALVFILLAVVSGLSVTLSELLKHLLEGHRPLIEGGLPMFIFQAFVELFEKLISLFSNSMSFVRVGAFAVAHAGLSGAILVLAGMVGGGGQGLGWWATMILGNLFIVGFEGLIVGIQTMRLHYYEFFSKFFVGGGTAYEPLLPLLRSEE